MIWEVDPITVTRKSISWQGYPGRWVTARLTQKHKSKNTNTKIHKHKNTKTQKYKNLQIRKNVKRQIQNTNTDIQTQKTQTKIYKDIQVPTNTISKQISFKTNQHKTHQSNRYHQCGANLIHGGFRLCGLASALACERNKRTQPTYNHQ